MDIDAEAKRLFDLIMRTPSWVDGELYIKGNLKTFAERVAKEALEEIKRQCPKIVDEIDGSVFMDIVEPALKEVKK